MAERDDHQDDLDLLTLVQQFKWPEATELIQRDPKSVYLCNHPSYPSRRSVLHELCRQATFHDEPGSGELSDEEEELEEEEKEDCYRTALLELTKIAMCASLRVDPVHSFPRYDDLVLGDELDVDLTSSDELDVDLASTDEGSSAEHELRSGTVHSIVTARDVNGNTPLHILCANGADPAMMQVILDFTRSNYDAGNPSRRLPTAHDLISAKNNHGCTPLHFIAEGTCPYSALKLIMEFCQLRPNAICPPHPHPFCIKDRDGDTCLHWAFAAYTSTRRLCLLIRAYPPSLMILNGGGRYALDDYLCASFSTDSYNSQQFWSEIEAILRTYHATPEGDIWYPLHTIAETPFCRHSLLELGIREDTLRGHVKKRDKNSLLPLHHAANCWPLPYAGTNAPTKISTLLNEYPRAAQLVTNDGRLALHLAAISNQLVDDLKCLIFSAPETLSIIDPLTKLYPFMLAAAGKHSNLNTVYEILRFDPELVRSGPVPMGGQTSKSLDQII